MKKLLCVFFTLIFISSLVSCDFSLKKVNNPFFFDDSVSEVKYSGKFFFYDVIEKDVIMYIRKVQNLKSGSLFKLELEHIEGFYDTERFLIGLFYVQEHDIYKINYTEENLEILLKNEIPEHSVIVCSEHEILNPLDENEKGWHHYLKADGGIRSFYSYDNQTETGYYETFVWERNKGLIGYRSGYGAERESIELSELIN